MQSTPAEASLDSARFPEYGDEEASDLRAASAQPVSLFRAIFWGVALSVYFMLVYNGCNWASARRAHVGTLYFAWERFIPFIPIAIFPYMSIDIFYFFSPLLCRDRGELRTLAQRIVFVITLAGVCFLLFPLQMGTVHPKVGGLSGKLFALLGSFDKPYNLVPSLHVALLCILWVIYNRHTHGMTQRIVQVWFVMILISTVVTDQHHVIDLVGGFILALLSFYLIPDVPAVRDSQIPDGAARIRNFRVARNYAMGGGILALLAFILYPWGLLLLWPATAGALVSFAYFHVGASIFRKSNGRLPFSTRILLGPYLIISGIFHLHLNRRREAYCKVAPGVWLGARLSPAQAQTLLAEGVTAVVDLTSECSETPAFRQLRYLNLQLLDLTPPTMAEVHTAVAFMREHSDQGVYVHCAMGVSRSVCIVAAYLLWLEKEKTVDQTYAAIKSVRSHARMYTPARQTLEAWRSALHQ